MKLSIKESKDGYFGSHCNASLLMLPSYILPLRPSSGPRKRGMEYCAYAEHFSALSQIPFLVVGFPSLIKNVLLEFAAGPTLRAARHADAASS